MSALTVALGVLIAVVVIITVIAVLIILYGAWLLLWHGIDDYGPLKHWWHDRRRR